MTSPGLLRVEGLTCRFGGLLAVDSLSFVLGQGQLMGLIGPNGAGKTTVFNLLTGAVRPTSGRVFYRDQEITGHKAHRVNRLGLARTFQNIRLFGELSALDNVLVGFHGRLQANFLSAILRLPGYVAAERQMLARAAELLDLVGLGGLKDERAGNLAYGQQRKLEITLPLANSPDLLLLDEPSCGLTTAESADITNRIRALGSKITVLMIAHDMDLVFGVADRVILLHYGEIACEGTCEEIRANQMVRDIYMGSRKSLAGPW